MYEVRPESVKTFITDRNISLPRFQRKQTWDEKKNFQLCISVFKGYPMGVCIINTEKEGAKSKRFLIDGRQRRNALSQMYENPEVIGLWAKKFLGFKLGIDKYDLGELFDEKINQYLETDEELFTDATNFDDNVEDMETGDMDMEDTDDDELDDEIGEVGNDGLKVLFNILLLTYKKTKHATGFTAPFDFTKYLTGMPFVDSDEKNSYVINGKKLKGFIDEYRNACINNNEDYDSQSDIFAEYLLSRSKLKTINNASEEKTIKDYKNNVSNKWEDIRARFDIVEKMDAIMSSCKIGLIEVKGFKPADSQKIFNIINSEGVKLTAVEIMSAKSYWNKKINSPSGTMVESAKELYENMGIKINDVYRWDIPATLLSRLGENVIFKQLSWDSVNKRTEFEKKITLGFKLMAGIYKGGIKKEDVDAMGKDESNIDWDMQSEGTIANVCSVIKLIEESSYFKFLKTWRTSIMELTSDAIALDFLLILYYDWIRKDKPIGSGTKTKQFQKNAFILWDKLIYEYVRKQWRGSSDSKIANDIKALDNENDVLEPVPKDNWIKLLNEIYNENTVEGSKISVDLMKPILYHMYCIKGIDGPGNYTIEVDHIIPQSDFKSSTIPMKNIIQDNLFNLGLLPKKDNISKSNHKLKHIENDWLISQIKRYEFIGPEKFDEFSSVNNYKKLFSYIKKVYDSVFGKNKNGNESSRGKILDD